jgi:hypothetical protein
MSAESSSLPDNDCPGSFFARVFRDVALCSQNIVPPSAPHALGPNDGETDSHTSAPQHRTAIESLRSASTENYLYEFILKRSTWKDVKPTSECHDFLSIRKELKAVEKSKEELRKKKKMSRRKWLFFGPWGKYIPRRNP